MKVTYRNPGFEHSIDSILLFQTDDTTPYWSDALFYFYPQVSPEKMKKLRLNEKKEYIKRELKTVWDGLEDELNSKVNLYNMHFAKYHDQIEDALTDAFELDTRTIFNDLVGNISLNPVCPRFLKERYFDVFYKNSERGCLGMSIHEVIHYIWFYVWNNHFGDNYSEYDTPSLKWILSEMVVESIMDDERLASVNPYYPREHGGCVYRYFQDMNIQGKPILDTLRELYKTNHITDYGLNYQKTGKELMTKDELAVMDGGKCIMQLRGVRPFFSNKYDITKHKRYKYLSDYDSKLAFDIEKYMSRKLVLKKDDPIEVVDIDLSEDELSN